MPDRTPALQGWYVILLQAGSAARRLAQRLARHGATALTVPGYRLVAADPEPADAALRAALAAERCIFTSPAAVRHARRLPGWRAPPPGQAIAVGRGTAAALRAAGVSAPQRPQHADSEGVLALPELAQVEGRGIGLVTAPGGRDRIAPVLRARGAHVLRADVYLRAAPRLTRRHAEALRDAGHPRALLLSSAEALRNVLAALPADAAAVLRASPAIVASARLAQSAADAGLEVAVQAGSAHADALVAALLSHAKHEGFR